MIKSIYIEVKSKQIGKEKNQKYANYGKEIYDRLNEIISQISADDLVSILGFHAREDRRRRDRYLV